MSGDKTQPLDPCPFCGILPDSRRSIGETGWKITCDDSECGYAAVFAHTEEEAIAQWQTRRFPAPTLSPQGLPPAGLREKLAKWYEERAYGEESGPVAPSSYLIADEILAIVAADRERGGEG